MQAPATLRISSSVAQVGSRTNRGAPLPSLPASPELRVLLPIPSLAASARLLDLSEPA